VTFRWSDDQPAYDVLVRLISHTDQAYDEGELDRYLMNQDTDGWSVTLELPAALRTSYQLCPVRDAPVRGQKVDDERWTAILAAGVADPLNPLTHPAGCTYGNPGPASVLEMPEAPSSAAWSRAGTAESVVRRQVLDDGSVVTIARPPDPQGLAVMFDGARWIDLGLPNHLDLPITVVLIDSIRGLPRRDALARPEVFAPVAIELAQRWATTGPTALIGQSLGGLAATFTARQRPDLFDTVVGQSTSFWWDADGFDGASVIDELEQGPLTTQRFFYEAGSTEGDLLLGNRRLAAVLAERGCDSAYREYEGGHDYACWQVGLIDALQWAFPASRRS
jgi:enterochelin esterase family protein